MQLPKTDVPWADRQWPIIRGCSEASIGCRNCYAKTWFSRFGKRLGWEWGKPIFFPENLEMPTNTRKPCRVFVAPMSDLWHPDIDPHWHVLIGEQIAANPQHVFILLTKRPENIPSDIDWLPNVWIGVSCENQEQYDERWPELCRRVTAKVRFVSVEPMLTDVWCMRESLYMTKPDWVIAGPETGRGARPCNPNWIDTLTVECALHGIPFFDKREPWTRREYPQ